MLDLFVQDLIGHVDNVTDMYIFEVITFCRVYHLDLGINLAEGETLSKSVFTRNTFHETFDLFFKI